jgi:gliding motility-associated-like protein
LFYNCCSFIYRFHLPDIFYKFETYSAPLNRLLFIPAFFLFSVTANGQAGLCPPNMDFEQGNFSNWVCRTGLVSAPGGVHTITWNPPAPPSPTNHSLITVPGGSDTYGRFPTLCPNGSSYSVLLGNDTYTPNGPGWEASGISYTYTIPTTTTFFSILFNYAVVFQDPQHFGHEQPRFFARIKDLTAGQNIPCVDFDFTASASLPGFQQSPVNPTVFYKGWTPVTINLSGFTGRTIEVEFIATECTRGGHFGYAYIDVNTNCNGAITGNFICPGNPGITLTAPFGFQNYTWYTDNTFTTVLSTSQTLNLTPAPLVGTSFPVIVEPFNGFGCRDTLYGVVQVAGSPPANAGPNQAICANANVLVGTAPSPGLSYVWTPAAQVSNPNVANPLAWNRDTSMITEFIVTTTDILTGCAAKDTMYITSKKADTTITLLGKSTYCIDDTNPGVLSVSPALAAVQWYDGATPIAGATGFSYQPTVSGSYWAQVQQYGCTDSTRRISFAVNSLPVSDAGPDVNVCINQTVQLGTASTPGYTYQWTPAAQVNDAAIANPQANAIGASPQQFIVQTTNTATGCRSYDTTIVTGLVMDTAILLTGKKDYCTGDPAAGSLSVNNTLLAVQWYNGFIPITGQNGYNFQPLISGSYWAEMQYAGCRDSTPTVVFNIHDEPVADFTKSDDSVCIRNSSITFTNRSLAPDGAAMTYLWRFSNGSTDTAANPVKAFSAPGTYRVSLVATTQYGCINTTADSFIYVMPDVKAGFTWDSICINRPVLFTNLSQENSSPQINYLWRLGNGDPDYRVRNLPPVIYTIAGQANVSLRAEALGCEAFADSVIQNIQINAPKPGITYRTITTAEGVREYIHARPGVGNIYNWQPRLQLTNYTAQYTQFTATNDVRYTITITDPHTCTTIDTLQMLVLKKPGYYLPTAFTPNADGLNDFAIPYLVGMKGLKSFAVFSRGGQRLFFTNTYLHGWDGKYLGEAQPNGVYVWVLEYYDNTNKVVQQKGTIAIVR